MHILVTGAAGFIGGHLVSHLLDCGHKVTGLDNFSKYGPVSQPSDGRAGYRFVEGDAKNTDLLADLSRQADCVIANAAMAGGVAYFHQLAYDILAENERIAAATFDAAIQAFQKGNLQRIVAVSSGLVFQHATQFPTPEDHRKQCPAPTTAYGLQKLALEGYARAAFDQYGLPFVIARPFNCIGPDEARLLAGKSEEGQNQIMGHVVVDLAKKVMQGQDPLHILGTGLQVRHFTHVHDLARGLALCAEHPDAAGEDFNLSVNQGITILDLARLIWEKVRPGEEFRFVSDPAYGQDVPFHQPETKKAKKLLGFSPEISMSKALDEVLEGLAGK